MEEVLWHSTTFRLAKSILVKIPKLPTMRVIGSQDISTILLALGLVSVAEVVAVSIWLIRFEAFGWSHSGRLKPQLLAASAIAVMRRLISGR